MNRLLVSSSPHIRLGDSIPRIMWSVVVALLPATIASGYFFGWRALYVTGLSVIAAVLCEAAVQKFRKLPVTVGDGSAVVTGMLLAFCLPPTVRWFVPVVGSAIAILIAKHCFGGLGYNIWNPALVGRAFVHSCYPQDMNPPLYPVVRTAGAGDGPLGWLRDFFNHFAVNVGTVPGTGHPPDAITGASPLAALKRTLVYQHGGTADALAGKFTSAFQNTAALAKDNPGAPDALMHKISLWNAFLGNRGGDIGEACILLLILGAVFLLVRGYIKWYVPVLYVATVAALVSVLPLPVGPGGGQVWFAAFRAGGDVGWQYLGYHVLCGGLMLGALYMATDMVTSPLTAAGNVIFAVGCGLLTSLIRLYGGFPEGVCYSILLMNTAVPLIDRWTRPRVFGEVRKPKEATT